MTHPLPTQTFCICPPVLHRLHLTILTAGGFLPASRRHSLCILSQHFVAMTQLTHANLSCSTLPACSPRPLANSLPRNALSSSHHPPAPAVRFFRCDHSHARMHAPGFVHLGCPGGRACLAQPLREHPASLPFHSVHFSPLFSFSHLTDRMPLAQRTISETQKNGPTDGRKKGYSSAQRLSARTLRSARMVKPNRQK